MTFEEIAERLERIEREAGHIRGSNDGERVRHMLEMLRLNIERFMLKAKEIAR